MRKSLLLCRLAFGDLWFDRKVSFCTVASLVAVIAPLLLLFSLKYGVVSQLRQHLIDDPQNLEIVLIGNGHYGSDWFRWLNAQPEMQFAIPLTRSLSAVVDLRKNMQHFATNVEIIPTAVGDPLLEELPLRRKNGVVLSSLTAEKLQAHTGETITLIATRTSAGHQEKDFIDLVVEGILPDARFTRHGAFVPLSTLIAIEDYRDGSDRKVSLQQLSKQPQSTRQHFAKARLYAKSLDDVAPLAKKLRVNYHIDTRTQAKAIDNVKAIDRVLNVIFLVIALTAVVGCLLSLIGAFLSNIERKHKDIAVLRLLGFQSTDVTLYLIWQTIVLSSVAFFASWLLYLLGSFSVNRVLGTHLVDSPFVSQLQLQHLAIGFAIGLALAIVVASIGAIRATKIQPAESLRDV